MEDTSEPEVACVVTTGVMHMDADHLLEVWLLFHFVSVSFCFTALFFCAVLQFGQHPSQLLQQELPMRVCLRLFLSKLGSLAFHLPTVMNNPFPFRQSSWLHRFSRLISCSHGWSELLYKAVFCWVFYLSVTGGEGQMKHL